MTTSALLLVAILIGGAVWAVRADMLTQRIPNRLTGSVLCAGLALQFAGSGWIGLRDSGLGVLIGFTALMPFYLARAMGAGDVKLLAAFGSLLGPASALAAAIYTLLAGAVLALGYLTIGMIRAAASPVDAPWRMRIHGARERLRELRRERFPYAMAIATGALGASAQRGDLQNLTNHLTAAIR